jgi:hypothetical protein
MVKLLSVALVCVGTGGCVASVPVPVMVQEPVADVRYLPWVVVRPVPCDTDTDCERKNGGPVVLNRRPVYRT